MSGARTAYLVSGVRTPIGRYGGALAGVRPDDLNGARMSALLAGLPAEVAGITFNRLCASGLDAVGYAARSIIAGDADLMIAGGVESMSRAPFVQPKAQAPYARSAEIHDSTIGWRFINPLMQEQYGTDGMPQTAQNVADEYDISREDQDAFALRSQERAAKAQSNGRPARSPVPVPVPQRKGESVVVARDEHPRATSAETLAGLRPLFPGGSITAGNSSGVNDGAAALLVASAETVERFDLQPLARIISTASAGVQPRVMGIGPIPAVNRPVSYTHLTLP